MLQLNLFDFINLEAKVHITTPERICTLMKFKEGPLFAEKSILDIFTRKCVIGKEDENTVYLVNKLMAYLRPLIKESIHDEVFKPEGQLADLMGNTPVSEYIINSLELTRKDTDIISYFCENKENNLVFRAKTGFSRYTEDYSIEKLKASHSGDCRCLKGINPHKQPEQVHKINDVAVLVARAVVFNMLKQHIKTLKESEKASDIIYNRIIEKVSEAFSGCIENGVLYVTDSSERLIRIAEKLCNILNITLRILTISDEKISNSDIADIADIAFEIGIHKVTTALELLDIMPVDISRFTSKISRKSKITLIDLELYYYFSFMVQLRAEEIEISKYERELEKKRHTYAKSFQTKKCTEKMRRLMKASPFLKDFSFVEYDEDIDLDKIPQIYTEWGSIRHYFSKSKSATLRFRKLGNHNALGLFYPSVNCICVDLRSPSSFAHEAFHMMDYACGRVSSGYSFRKVLEKYSFLITEEVENDVDLKKNLKGKYDLNYFLIPTEIFARCGEIFLSRIMGIDNSLIKPEGGKNFAYPNDKELNNLITEFFCEFYGLEGGVNA